jgi:hypothetical protein
MDKGTIRLIGRKLRSFAGGTQGTLLTEALIVVPVVTIFAVGILEFGNVFWQRHQVQVAVRDVARYWARCRDTVPFDTCDLETAHNLAFYGKPIADPATDALRIPGWSDVDDLSIDRLPEASEDPTLVRVTGTHTYTGSPLMRLLQIEAFDFSYTHEQRYIGW